MTYRSANDADHWSTLLAASRTRDGAACRAILDALDPCDPFVDLYAPLLARTPPDRPFVVAHLAQSLDGCIALPKGESQWISGHDDLVHTHRLRALCDAVVVGASTVLHDDPQLTVRHVEGPDPLRVVLDSRGRLEPDYRVFRDPDPPTLVLSTRPREGFGPEVEVLPPDDGWLDPADVLTALGRRGVRRVLVEGGGVTVSRFLAAGLVDRLHLVVAPLLVGEGRPSLSGVLAPTLDGCPRPTTRVVPLGQDWLFDCVFE